jgi:hypothetical protein
VALVPCPECGAEISEDAPACPHCGRPNPDIPPKQGCADTCAGLLGVLVILAIVAFIFIAL